MSRSRHTIDDRPAAGAERGSSHPGRPSSPSNPWEAEWHQPRRRDLDRKHALIPESTRQRHQQSAAAVAAAAGPAARRRRRTVGRLLDVGALVSTAYWYFAVATLVIAIGIPFVSGWSSAAVVTGSMEPVISAGDMVSFAPYDGSALSTGAIVQFRDPARPGQTTTHRIVAVNPDGTYTTRGDANGSNDSAPLHPEGIVGVARMVTPGAALPHVWWRNSQPWMLLAWLTLTMGAVALMRAHARKERLDRIPSRHPRSTAAPAVAMLLIIVVVGAGAASRANARFTSASGVPENHLSAAADFTPFETLGSAGAATCASSTESSVSVTTAIPAGSVVVVRFALRDIMGPGAYSAVDSAGNTYTLDGSAADAVRIETAILSAHVANPLAVGDQITVTHPSGRATAVAVDAFSGVAATDRVLAVGTGAGNDITPTVPVTLAQGPGLAIGQIGVRDTSSVTAAAPGWSELASGAPVCDRALTHHGAWRQASSGAFTFAPTFEEKRRWAGVVVVYRTD